MPDWEDDVTPALVEEASRKSALVWVTVPGQRVRPVWHVWHDGGVCVVSGGLEQPLPGIETAERVDVTVRSKDKGGRLVTFAATVTAVAPPDELWEPVVAALHAARLNPPDGEEQPLRWARESRVWRLLPTGDVSEAPGAMPAGSLAAVPAPTPATTRGRLPLHLGRRRRRR